MTTYDPTSLLSNLKRAFSGFGAQVPGAAPSPFAIPKPAPFAMPAPVQAPTMGPAPIAPMQGPAPFIGPRPVAPVIAPPMAKATPVAPVVPRTSTGQTINTATGGTVAGATPAVVPPAPTIPTPVAPIVPTAPSAEQSAVTSAEQAYKTASVTTPEQEAAQAELDRLTQSIRGGYEGAGQQAIPLEFITGQQKAIEQRGLRLAEPLTTKLARMEAKRLSGLETSKFALERADKALSTTSAAKTAEATAAESARRFAIEQKGTEATRVLAEKKFAQDAKEFGMSYAQKEREISQKTDEATKVGDDKAIQLLGSAQIVNDILKNPGVISGVVQSGSVPFTAGATIKNKYEQLRATLALGARGLLKGGGAISDYESKVLNQSTSALGRNQTEEQFTQTLKEIKGILSSNAGLPTSVQVLKNGAVVDSGDLSREDIYDAIKQGYEISYQ